MNSLVGKPTGVQAQSVTFRGYLKKNPARLSEGLVWYRNIMGSRSQRRAKRRAAKTQALESKDSNGGSAPETSAETSKLIVGPSTAAYMGSASCSKGDESPVTASDEFASSAELDELRGQLRKLQSYMQDIQAAHADQIKARDQEIVLLTTKHKEMIKHISSLEDKVRNAEAAEQIARSCLRQRAESEKAIQEKLDEAVAQLERFKAEQIGADNRPIATSVAPISPIAELRRNNSGNVYDGRGGSGSEKSGCEDEHNSINVAALAQDQLEPDMHIAQLSAQQSSNIQMRRFLAESSALDTG